MTMTVMMTKTVMIGDDDEDDEGDDDGDDSRRDSTWVSVTTSTILRPDR
jgi:hypothetical protein